MTWAQAPIVTIPEIVCPHCEHVGSIRTWTQDNGDGSRTQFRTCKRCSGRFKLVIDPHIGEDPIWPEVQPDA